MHRCSAIIAHVLFVLFNLLILSTVADAALLRHKRVIDGSDARRGDFPYQAHFWMKEENKTHYIENRCGAVIIDANWILTAAHCTVENTLLINITRRQLTVRVGQHRTDCLETVTRDHDVKQIFNHEQYNSSSRENDIALLQVGTIHFNEYVQPIELPDAGYRVLPGSTLLVSGWGETRYEENSTVLQYTELRATAEPICSRRYRLLRGYSDDDDNNEDEQAEDITPGMLCADSKDSNTCEGDSGGPLVQSNGFKPGRSGSLNNRKGTKDPRVLVGIVSWGEYCTIRTAPGVYTDVAFYRDWIRNLIETTTIYETQATVPSGERCTPASRQITARRKMSGRTSRRVSTRTRATPAIFPATDNHNDFRHQVHDAGEIFSSFSLCKAAQC